jgi:hypothetical protein
MSIWQQILMRVVSGVLTVFVLALLGIVTVA